MEAVLYEFSYWWYGVRLNLAPWESHLVPVVLNHIGLSTMGITFSTSGTKSLLVAQGRLGPVQRMLGIYQTCQ